MFFCKLSRCCCVSLNVGTILIGIFDFLFATSSFVWELVYSTQELTWLTFAVIYAFLSLFLILGVKMDKPNLILPWLLVNFIFLIGMFVVILQCTKLYLLYSPIEKPSNTKKSPDKLLILVLLMFRYVSIMVIVSSSIYAILCVLVILGVKTEKSTYLLPWIVITMIGIILMFIGQIFIFVSFFKTPKKYTTDTSQDDEDRNDLILDFLFLINFIGLSINIYLWTVVNSCHQELRKPFERACIPTHDLNEQSISQNMPPVVVISERVLDSSYPPPYDLDMSTGNWPTEQPSTTTPSNSHIAESLPYIHISESSLGK